MFDFIDITQNTDEWLALRAGKLTSSKLAIVMATPYEYMVLALSKDKFAIANTKYKKVLKLRYSNKIDADRALLDMRKKDLTKAFGEPAKQYAVTIAIEQITGEPIPSTYTNDHMERGHEQEPLAAMLYEQEFFCNLSNGGFFTDGETGCSPDRLVGEDGVIEIKSVIGHVHYANIKRQNVDPSYKWQVVGNVKFTGRDWIDFVSYCGDFPPDKRLYTYRIYAKDLAEEFKELETRMAEFKELIATTKQTILDSNYINQ